MERSAPGLRLLRLESAAASAVALTCGLCVLVGLDGCEVRLCDLCALMRPRVPCVSCVSRLPRCLFTGNRVRLRAPRQRAIFEEITVTPRRGSKPGSLRQDYVKTPEKLLACLPNEFDKRNYRYRAFEQARGGALGAGGGRVGFAGGG